MSKVLEILKDKKNKERLLKYLGAYHVETDETYVNPVVSDYGLKGDGIVLDLMTGELSVSEDVREYIRSHDDMREAYKISEIFEKITCNSSLMYMDGNDFMMYSADCFFFADYEDDGELNIFDETPIWCWPYVYELLTERLLIYGKANLDVHWDLVDEEALLKIIAKYEEIEKESDDKEEQKINTFSNPYLGNHDDRTERYKPSSDKKDMNIEEALKREEEIYEKIKLREAEARLAESKYWQNLDDKEGDDKNVS